MTIAIWIIAICSVIRIIQNSIQLSMMIGEKEQRKNLNNEFIESLRKDNKAWVEDTLNEYLERVREMERSEQMKWWNSYTDDITLKDGTVVKEYTITFRTTDRDIYKRIERFFQDIMNEADALQTDSEITRTSLRTDCNGCRFVGTYDTEFPCTNCTRKNKDYYDADTPQTDCDNRYAVRTDSGEVVAYACPLGCEQTDCGWGEPK